MPSPIPTDAALYARIKASIPGKPSAYRSGHIVSAYKHAFAKKHGPSRSPYRGQATRESGLGRWFAEEWRNSRGEVGYTKDGDTYRPTRRVSSATPATWNELSKAEKAAATREKKATGRVARFKREDKRGGKREDKRSSKR